MKIHVPTKAVLTTDKAAYLLYRELSGGKAEPIADVVFSDWDIYEYTVLTFSQETEKVSDILIDQGDGSYAYGIVALLPQEVADTLQAYKDGKINNNRFECSNLIYASYSQKDQSNVALGVYVNETMATDISLMIEEENRIADLIDTGVDFAAVDVQQALLSWPTLTGV